MKKLLKKLKEVNAAIAACLSEIEAIKSNADTYYKQGEKQREIEKISAFVNKLSQDKLTLLEQLEWAIEAERQSVVNSLNVSYEFTSNVQSA